MDQDKMWPRLEERKVLRNHINTSAPLQGMSDAQKMQLRPKGLVFVKTKLAQASQGGTVSGPIPVSLENLSLLDLPGDVDTSVLALSRKLQSSSTNHALCCMIRLLDYLVCLECMQTQWYMSLI